MAGVIGLLLSVVFYFWPATEDLASTSDAKIGRARRVVTSIETPIRFADFAVLPPSERTALVNRYRGKRTVWEGFLSETIGFELAPGSDVPMDKPLGIRITPTGNALPQIAVECRIGELVGGDAGLENGMRLHLLSLGQRVRMSGELQGDGDHPVLEDAFLEAEWPVGE